MAARVSSTWEPKGIEIDKNNIKLDKNNLADFLANATSKDIDYNFIMEVFGTFNGKRLANPYDIFIVPAHTFHYTEGNMNKTKGKKDDNVFIQI